AGMGAPTLLDEIEDSSSDGGEFEEEEPRKKTKTAETETAMTKAAPKAPPNPKAPKTTAKSKASSRGAKPEAGSSNTDSGPQTTTDPPTKPRPQPKRIQRAKSPSTTAALASIDAEPAANNGRDPMHPDPGSRAPIINPNLGPVVGEVSDAENPAQHDPPGDEVIDPVLLTMTSTPTPATSSQQILSPAVVEELPKTQG
ncbi:hypothetical protein V5O48_018562, partial [Marasmius crinis-equi]